MKTCQLCLHPTMNFSCAFISFSSLLLVFICWPAFSFFLYKDFITKISTAGQTLLYDCMQQMMNYIRNNCELMLLDKT